MARNIVSTTVERIRRQLSSGYRFEINLLNGTITDTDTTLSVLLPITAGLQPGAMVFIGVEAMRVTAVSVANSTIDVLRGQQDSTAVAHTDGDEILINPRFSPLDIFDAMQDEIASYGPQLFRVDTQEFAVADVQDTLELPIAWNDCYTVLDVRRQWADNGNVSSWPRVKFRFQRLGPSATSGQSIIRFIDTMQTGTVYVQVARPFVLDSFTMATDLIADTLLPESMLDVLSMGTKLRLLVDNENGRTARTAQDEPRRAEETPVGATVQPYQFNNALYRNRRQEEVNKLRALWPMQVM
jgi:hypothetical protein